MYDCRVVYVLLYIPMNTEGGSMDPQDPQDPPLTLLSGTTQLLSLAVGKCGRSCKCNHMCDVTEWASDTNVGST